MKKTAFILMILEILSKIFGFVKYIILGYYYGTSYITDAYLISLTIPLTIFDFIGNGISTTFIPVYSKMISCNRDNDSSKFINNLINVLFIVSTLLIGLSIVFAPFLVKIFASGFSGETFSLTVKLTRISALGIYFSLLVSILRGFLYANKSYLAPNMVNLPFNLIIIISIIISSKTDIVFLSLGTLLAMFAEFVAIAYFSYKKGYRYCFRINFKDKNLNNMMRLSMSTIIGTSVKDINKLVNRTIASQIIVGGISALNYAARLNQFVHQIFVTSIVTVLYPTIAKMAAEANMHKFKISLSEAVRSIYLIVIPAAIGAMIFSKPIVTLLFGGGAFDLQAINMTSDALFFYSVGMIASGSREVLSRAFYSLQDTKTPMVNAVIAMIINVVLNIILSRFLGIGGLAFAASISTIICTGLLYINLRKKIGSFGMKNTSIFFMKVLLASMIMGLLAKLSYKYLLKNIGDDLSLVISIGIGAWTYLIIIYLMKLEDIDIIVNTIKAKLLRKLHMNKWQISGINKD